MHSYLMPVLVPVTAMNMLSLHICVHITWSMWGSSFIAPLYPYSFLFVIIIGTVLSIRLPCFVIVNTVSLIGYGIN